MSPIDPDDTAERRVLLREVAKSVERLCRFLEAAKPTMSQPVPAVPVVAAPSPPYSPTGLAASMSLTQFRNTVAELTEPEREQMVDAALTMIEQVYVHLPLKRAMHACDPIQRLKLLKYRLADTSERGFHDEMITIFHSLRDLHTNYMLPVSYQGKTAYLPFLVEEYFEPNSTVRRYLVTKTRPVPAEPMFVPGVLLTHWNGIPIERSIELNAEREAGSNADARHARGLEALTLRPMGYTAPPDEDWVVITYKSNDNSEARELRLDWEVFEPPASPTGIDLKTAALELALVFGVDARTEAVRRARKALFDPKSIDCERHMATAAVSGGLQIAMRPVSQEAQTGHFDSGEIPNIGVDTKGESIRRSKKALFFDEAMAMEQQMARAVSGAAAGGGLGQVAAPSAVSLMPDVFAFKKVSAPQGELGYIRIYTFMVSDPNAFVSEFIRISRLLPTTGLIIDVRGNGGGNILAGERLLQVLTPSEIEPERFHFINTPLTLQLCQAANVGFDVARWTESIEQAIETGETYSRGFSLDAPEEYNRIGQQYQGPVVLIIDALCYSTTDIFSAGFQDHKIGQILGVQGRTGAGGANVWDYGLLTSVLPNLFPPLPKGAGLRVAIRRTTRVKERAGVSLEDLGVKPDATYAMSEKDVLHGNVDLIANAAQLLAGQRVRSLSGKVDRSQPPAIRLAVKANNVNRVDVYFHDRPMASGDVQNGALMIDLPSWAPGAGSLELRGFDGGELVVVGRVGF